MLFLCLKAASTCRGRSVAQFTFSVSWQMIVLLREVVTHFFCILGDKLAVNAAIRHVALPVALHLTLCEERHFAGAEVARNQSEAVCGRQVDLIFLTICAAELAALLRAGKWAFRVTTTVEDFEVVFQSTWLGKDLAALRTFVFLQLSFAQWSFLLF